MQTQESASSSLHSYAKWLKELGVTSITGWRWRKRGWIKTISIAGRQYVSEKAIREFEVRAETGEFAALGREPSSNPSS